MDGALPFNESQQRRILSNAEYADKLLADIETILASSDSGRLFRRHHADVTPQQARLIRSSIALFRRQLGRFLLAAAVDGEARRPRFGALHSILVTLAFVRIALQELAPEHLRGYGELAPEAESALRGVTNQLEGLVSTLEAELRSGGGVDLQARLERISTGAGWTALLRTLERVITEADLTEFRPSLARLVEKLETPSFEVAAFGRVSSGKSSLLNRLLGEEVLPVGVTPVTAVPVRLQYGGTPSLTARFAGGRSEEHGLDQLAMFATEEHNPANRREVLRLIARVPSPLLEDGVVFVDTPGLGSLATTGAAETLSYLPRCDLGLVLVSAVTPLNEEDLATVDLLARSGTPAMVLLSKADLLGSGDLERAMRYTGAALERELGVRLPVRAVSVMESHAALLAAWREQDLLPVLARHKELALESVQRKALALRQSVSAALRSQLEGAGTSLPREALEQAERALRGAAAEMESARRAGEAACDSLRGRSRAVLAEALEMMGAKAGADPCAAAEALRVAALRACDATATDLKDQLERLCAGLSAALEAARTLMRPGAERTGPGLDCSRGSALPIPACEGLPKAVKAPVAAGLPWIGRRMAMAWLEKQAGAAVRHALEAYARSLEVWLHQRLDSLQQHFDAEAGVYAAEIARALPAEAAQAGPGMRAAQLLEELEHADGMQCREPSPPGGTAVTPVA